MSEAVLERRVVKAVAVRAVPSGEHQRHAAQLQRERDAELAAARAAGRVEGHAAGVAETLARGTEAELRGAAALEALSQTVRAQADREVAATSATVFEVATEIATWVLRRELADGGRTLLARLETGLAALLPSPTTRIAVSPADADLVGEWASGRGRIGTTVVADARLAPGDAVVTTDAGRAEVTVAAALRTAEETLGLAPLVEGEGA